MPSPFKILPPPFQYSSLPYMVPYESSGYPSVPHPASFGYNVPGPATTPLLSGDNVIPQANVAIFTKPTSWDNASYLDQGVANDLTHGAPPPQSSKPYKGACIVQVDNGT